MQPSEKHSLSAKLSFDGADMDCGNGLLLKIRQHLDQLESGELLEILSTESSVEADLPAWCRLTSNELISWTKANSRRSFLICKGSLKAKNTQNFETSNQSAASQRPAPPPGSAPTQGSASAQAQGSAPPQGSAPTQSSAPTQDSIPNQGAGSTKGSAPTQGAESGSESRDQTTPFALRPFSVMGVGSWPRPKWLLPYIHQHLEGRISDAELDEMADDAVRLCVDAQIRAGADLLTDGEQRRDNYASFVGMHLNGCQLVPLTDLLPLVDEPEKFLSELKALDIPAELVRHPGIFGKLTRKSSFTLREYKFLSLQSQGHPCKIALPGPYLLSRIMWIDCISDKIYASREELADTIVQLLREEIEDLIQAGVHLIQLDEPVLTEVVFSGKKLGRSFMCGALSESLDTEEELAFAAGLINRVVAGFDRNRLALHICRGNWTVDESKALRGGYEPLISTINQLQIGTVLLEFRTSRAGDIKELNALNPQLRVGLGVVNQKDTAIESVESIVERATVAAELLGPQRIFLNSDCGFATFADNPIASSNIAEAKTQAMAQASKRLREKFSV